MKPTHIFLHWTAGSYTWIPNPSHYHTTITGDGQLHRHHAYDKFVDGHTWRRNSNSVALSLACMGPDARGKWPNSTNFGQYPPTPKQIEAMCLEAARIALRFGIPVDAEHVMTHAEAADLDGYGPKTTWERWDLLGLTAGYQNGGKMLRAKVAWYLKKLKAGEIK